VNISIHLNPVAIKKTAIVLTFLFGLVLDQQGAEASCGDYLQMGHVPAVVQISAAYAEVKVPQFPTGPRRCDGPGCSQSPGLVVHHVVTLLKSNQIKAFAISAIVESGCVVGQWVTCSCLSIRCSVLGSGVFRPPASL
jgi:hypothetical protein